MLRLGETIRLTEPERRHLNGLFPYVNWETITTWSQYKDAFGAARAMIADEESPEQRLMLLLMDELEQD